MIWSSEYRLPFMARPLTSQVTGKVSLAVGSDSGTRSIGLLKIEVIWRRRTRMRLEDVEFAMLTWVDLFNHRRILERIGDVPRAEFEAAYRRQQQGSPLAA